MKKGLIGALALAMSLAASAAPMMEKVHFLIPSVSGSGWDGTARGTGEALTKAGLLKQATYENMTGGGGGKAIGYMIENAASNQGVLMVSSTPIITRSLVGRFPQNFRDLTPIASIIGDYGALVVPADSPINTFADVLAIYRRNPDDLAMAGGSPAGTLDHLVAALAIKKAGLDPNKLKFLPFDGGREGLAGLMSGEADVLSSGLGEVLEMVRAGKVRILAVTSPARLPDVPTAPTLKEQGVDAVFVNWRGFFGPPGLSAAKRAQYIKMLAAMYGTPSWEAVRSRNGWADMYQPGDEFVSFLEAQEESVGALMQELGFL